MVDDLNTPEQAAHRAQAPETRLATATTPGDFLSLAIEALAYSDGDPTARLTKIKAVLQARLAGGNNPRLAKAQETISVLHEFLPELKIKKPDHATPPPLSSQPIKADSTQTYTPRSRL